MSNNPAHDIDVVETYIRDAEKYGLVVEVVYYALKYMKEHPDRGIDDAMDYGYWEWCK